MKFRFRLEKALHFARLNETVQKMEVAKTLQRIETVKARKLVVEEQLRSVLNEASQAPAGARAPFQATRIAADTDEISRLGLVLRKEEIAAERARAELGRLAMRRKALESLEEKRRTEFNFARNRQQQMEVEESFRLIPKKPD